MDYDKIVTVANAYAKELSGVIYIISATGVIINYYIPNSIPFIPGMHWVVLMSVLAIARDLGTSKKELHRVIGTKCHRCESTLLYTSLKCSNSDCNYKIKLDAKTK